MEKNTVSNFLWIIVTVIIMFALIAIASPFGVFIKNNLDTFTGNYIEENDYSTDDLETEMITLKISYFIVDDSGSRALTSVEQTLKKYQKYSIVSPEIEGYKPNVDVVSGQALTNQELTVQYTLANYSIVFVLNDGQWYEAEGNIPEYYTYNKQLYLPTADQIHRDNYTFGGWYEDKTLSDKVITQIDDCNKKYGNKVFYAKWIPDDYNIIYHLNDRPNEYGSGRHGAFYNALEYSDSVAQWSPEFTDGSGNLLDKYTSYDYGTQVKFPVAASKFGYDFVGWSTSPTVIDKNTVRTEMTESDVGEINLYAHWKRREYAINYHTEFTRPNGEKAQFDVIGTNNYTVTHTYKSQTTVSGYPIKYAYGDSFALPTSDTLYCQGYTADVWYNKPTSLSIGASPNFALTYSPANTIKKTTVSPPTAGYQDSDGTKKYDHTVLNLYVKAVPNKYKVVFDRNATENTRDYITDTFGTNRQEQTFTYDKTTALNANQYSIAGYKFVGWNTAPDGTGVSYKDKQEIINLTHENNATIVLYAQWEAQPVNVTFKYYYANPDNQTFGTPTTKTETFIANSNVEITKYIKDNAKTGYEFNEAKAYKNKTNTAANLLQTVNSIDKNVSLKVLPDGNLLIEVFYTRNYYTLTIITSNTSALNSGTVKVNTVDANNVTGDLKKGTLTYNVMYGENISLEAVHNLTYRIKNWSYTLDKGYTSAGTTSFSNQLQKSVHTVTMPNKNLTITLNSQDAEYKIKYHTNWSLEAGGAKTFKLVTGNNNSAFANSNSYTTKGSLKCNAPMGTLPKVKVTYNVDGKEHYKNTNWQTTASGSTEVATTTIVNETFLKGKNVTYTVDNDGYIILSLYAEWRISSTASDHTLQTKTVAATCTTAGSTTKSCKHCTYKQDPTTIKALGHTGSYVVTQKATCYRPQLKQRKCTRVNNGVTCNAKFGDVITGSKTDHNPDPKGQCNYTHTVTWSSTCTGYDVKHAWGTCRDIYCHNATFDKNGKYVAGCGQKSIRSLWCGTHGRGTRHTWACGRYGGVETGGNVARPNGGAYKGKLGWS